MTDLINHPKHYTTHPSGIECIEITENLTFCLGNAIKYIWRAGQKSSERAEDLKKALWYARRARAIGERFRDWELPRDINNQLVRKIRKVLADTPNPSLLRTALYTIVPELNREMPPPPYTDHLPLITALETEIGGA